MRYATIDALRESLAQAGPKQRSPEYVAKMMHPIPDTDVVQRENFIIQRCKDKFVVEFGASGLLTKALRKSATEYYGVDRSPTDNDIVQFDLDDVTRPYLPRPGLPDIIVCGEVLEHLTNPGWFLQRLREQYALVPTIFTTPNAFCRAASAHMRDGIENVNKDHVCWYSATTLRTLLTRYGYTIEEFYWYNGEPLTAEGMIVVVR